jgi:hypothetical protein
MLCDAISNAVWRSLPLCYVMLSICCVMLSLCCERDVRGTAFAVKNSAILLGHARWCLKWRMKVGSVGMFVREYQRILEYVRVC